jgi:NADPH:quinone reductase-like Zn-dependent oxidoreductase
MGQRTTFPHPAWQALVDHGRLKKGERVLVRGGAGGVGLFAVQLAAHLGAQVIATAEERDAGLVRNMGADLVISGRDTHSLIRLNVDVLVDAAGGPFPADLTPPCTGAGAWSP